VTHFKATGSGDVDGGAGLGTLVDERHQHLLADLDDTGVSVEDFKPLCGCFAHGREHSSLKLLVKWSAENC